MGKTIFRVEPEFFLTVAFLLIYHQERAVGIILGFLLIHEMGHALVYRLGGGKLRRITITSFGIRMETDGGSVSRGWEIAAVAAGPILNLAAAGIAWRLGYQNTGIAGMVLGAYNLFPAHFLDGGLLVELIAEAAGRDATYLTKWGSLALILLLTGVFLYAAFLGEFSVGLLLAILLSVLEYFKE